MKSGSLISGLNPAMRSSVKLTRWMFVSDFLYAALLLVSATIVTTAAADNSTDAIALKALDQAYAQAWKQGDADAVLALFTDDASLVPHHGDQPIVGAAAIRQFWFNPSYPPTVIAQWQRRSAEVLVNGDVGVVRGRARLTWEFDGIRTTIPDGNYVMIALRAGESWKIRMLTWNDDPRNWEQESTD